jgi:hypothetical protein
MPFRQYPQFDTDTVEAMTEAYDTVVARLRLIPADPRTGKLASLIVDLAKAGVRDADKLAEQARMGMK